MEQLAIFLRMVHQSNALWEFPFGEEVHKNPLAASKEAQETQRHKQAPVCRIEWNMQNNPPTWKLVDC